MFETRVTLEDYLKLDESIILYYFQIWQDEEDHDSSGSLHSIYESKFV